MVLSLLFLPLVHTCRLRSTRGLGLQHPSFTNPVASLFPAPTLKGSTAQPCSDTFLRSANILETKEKSPIAQHWAQDLTWECLSDLWFSALSRWCLCDFWLPFLLLSLMENWPELTCLTEFMARMSICDHILLKYPS